MHLVAHFTCQEKGKYSSFMIFLICWSYLEAEVKKEYVVSSNTATVMRIELLAFTFKPFLIAIAKG